MAAEVRGGTGSEEGGLLSWWGARRRTRGSGGVGERGASAAAEGDAREEVEGEGYWC